MEYKSPLSVRGDYFYCPLCFSLDSYWMCEYDCPVCFLRRLNRVWGTDQRVADPEKVRKKLARPPKNPKSLVAWMIRLKKTIRFGNKSDPFQKSTERQYRVSRRMLEVLRDLEWSVVLQTKTTEVVLEYMDILKGFPPGYVVVMPVISPGGDKDWEVLEDSGPTPPSQRLEDLGFLRREGISVGVNGEPFIPGYHTLEDFREMMKLLKSHGISTYNTYNLHLNPHVARRLVEKGLDLEKIWYMNQDPQWRKILPELIQIAEEEGIELGCPDFVNSGRYCGRANTCCGVDVPNPCRFNTHFWKRLLVEGKDPEAVVEETWEGYGDRELGERIVRGEPSDEIYTMGDVDGLLGG